MIDFSMFRWVATYKNTNIVVAVIPIDLIILLTIFLIIAKIYSILNISWFIVSCPLIVSIVYPFVKAIVIGIILGIAEIIYFKRNNK